LRNYSTRTRTGDLKPTQIRAIIDRLPKKIDRIGVFLNATSEEIVRIVKETELTGVQLHGDETVDFCQEIRQLLPEIEIIKALRIKNSESLFEIKTYFDYVDSLLLDAYHPQLAGGTGKTLDWELLSKFKISCPWFLSGGLTPNNVMEALNCLNPSGIDLSSGVERSPGDKDLEKVAQLFEKLTPQQR
jgi:phosphoribosylanthranilate isomerase